MKTAILVPKAAFEKRNAQDEAPCLCKDTPVRLVYKKGSINWLINVGDTIARGEPVCEALVEKAVLEIPAPAGGRLAEKCLQDGDSFAFGDTLGYIDDDTTG